MNKDRISRRDFLKLSAIAPLALSKPREEFPEMSEKEILDDFANTCDPSYTGVAVLKQRPAYLSEWENFTQSKESHTTRLSIPISWRDKPYLSPTDRQSGKFFFGNYPYSPRIIPVFLSEFPFNHNNDFRLSSNRLEFESGYSKKELFRLKTEEIIPIGSIEITWIGATRNYTQPSNRIFEFSLSEDGDFRSTQSIQSPHSTLFFPIDFEVRSIKPNVKFHPDTGDI